MNKDSKFWDNISERYAKMPIADEEAYQKKLAVTREHLSSEMNVLEFGCGTGGTAIAHAPFVKQILAIDISAKMIDLARGKANTENVHNITFRQSTIDEIVIPDETLDVVLGLSILHLLESKEDVIAKVYNMLKPGGTFITSTTCLGDTMKFFKFLAPIGRFLGFMPLLKVFPREELEGAIVDAGFHIDYQWQPAKGKAVFIVGKKVV
ncbi:class I SAM-dependent methyltransferase [Teredinibacter haidensis]|uniref:class I SAM-dependent methyltransferase n=1 Tax=Teredinibacter haidensis TaxID=2731755 RepID=UPI000948C032|nr:class I SAM-dependent methyltransferase [Teredinibacter haidensis]